MLVLGSGTKDNYADAVFDSAYDIFTLSTTTTDSVIISAVKPLVSRIKQCKYLLRADLHFVFKYVSNCICI